MISPKRKLVVIRRSSLDHVFDILRLCETGNNFRGALLFHRKSGRGPAGLSHQRELSAMMVCLP